MTAYFAAQLFSKQFFIPPAELQRKTMFANATYHYSSQKPFDKYTPDVYVPPFLFLQFLCIMGWIKVAEKLLNPFGDDHEDIKVKEIIDRNIQVRGSAENENTYHQRQIYWSIWINKIVERFHDLLRLKNLY